MQGSDLIRVSWKLLKSEFAIKPLKMSYTKYKDSYQVYIVSPNYGLIALIADPGEVSDFETNYKGTATEVGNEDEAVAGAMLPQVSPSILNPPDSGCSFGYLDTASTKKVTVRASDYTPPDKKGQRSVKSTSAEDTDLGKGARKVKITYLDASAKSLFTETVTLNGTTAVNTAASDIVFIEKMEVGEVGSLGENVGAIELWTDSDGIGSVIGRINAGDNHTYWAHHYVPAGKKCGIASIHGSSSMTEGGLTLNVLDPKNLLIPNRVLDATVRHGLTNIHQPYAAPLAVDGPAIIYLDERPDSALASTTFAGFSWIQL